MNVLFLTGLVVAASSTVAAQRPCIAESSRPGITTDSSRYVLRITHQQNPANGWESNVYRLALVATYTNHSAETLYLHYVCGRGDMLSYDIVRPEVEDAFPHLRTLIMCDWTREARPPIPVAPGDSFVDRVELESSDEPMARPRITVANRLGSFRLVYDVRRTNSLTRERPTDLVPLEERTSNTFEVVLAPDR